MYPRTVRDLGSVVACLGILWLISPRPQKLSADPTYEECKEETNGNEGCANCHDEGSVSYHCPDPHPTNELCEFPFPKVDDIGCFWQMNPCPNNAVIWTDTGCTFGQGESHQTTTPCSEIGEGGAFRYTTATNASAVEEECDGNPYN